MAKALANRLGLNHISEVRDSEAGELLGYSLCVDSLHPKSQARFNPADWENSIIVIDECEQVLWHLLNSPTCRGNRVAILQSFGELLRTVATSGGTVILSDADLSKVSIDYIQKLTDNTLDLWLLSNSHKPNEGNRKLITYDSPAELLAATYGAISAGEKVIIHCSSQKTKSKWSTQNLETFLANSHPGKSILRIDAETVSDPTHPAFGCIEHINEVILDYDIVLASPTIETGISIDVNHFDSVWCLANGVQTVDAVCQTIERVRSDVDRHICITTGGITKIGNGSDSPYSLVKSQQKAAAATLTALALAGIDEDGNNHQYHLPVWSTYASKVNQGFNDYENNILNKLQSEEFEVSSSPSHDPLATGNLKALVEECQELNYENERSAKIAAPNPDDLEFKRLENKTAKTKAERHKEAKGSLTRRYLTREDPRRSPPSYENVWGIMLLVIFLPTLEF